MALFCVPWVAQAQLELTVAQGTSNHQYVPFYGFYADANQHNQMLYPASEVGLMSGGTITQMVFYIDQSADNGSNVGDSVMGTWTVSLGETSETSLSGLNSSTSLTEVYQGYFDCSTGTLTIEFSNGYVYGGGNLLVDIDHAAAGYNSWYFLGVTHPVHLIPTIASAISYPRQHSPTLPPVAARHVPDPVLSQQATSRPMPPLSAGQLVVTRHRGMSISTV